MEYNKYLTALLGNFIIFLIASIMASEYSFLIASFIIPIGMVISSLVIDNKNIIASEKQIYGLLTVMISSDFLYCCYSAFCLYIFLDSWIGIIIGILIGYKLTSYSTRQWIIPSKNYLVDYAVKTIIHFMKN